MCRYWWHQLDVADAFHPMRILQYIAIFLGVVILIIGISYFSSGQKQASLEILDYCQEDARKAEITFQGTKNEGFNFYQSCIENITKTSPITTDNKREQLFNMP